MEARMTVVWGPSQGVEPLPPAGDSFGEEGQQSGLYPGGDVL